MQESSQTSTDSNKDNIPGLFPSQDQDYYRGPNSLKSETVKPHGKHSEARQRPDGLIVKEVKSIGSKTPKFVPRQVNRSKTFVKKTGEKQLQTDTLDSTLEKKQDSVNERLRTEALTLGEIKGPELPPEERAQRKSFKRAATTGDEGLEKTAIEIREKVQKVTKIPP